MSRYLSIGLFYEVRFFLALVNTELLVGTVACDVRELAVPYGERFERAVTDPLAITVVT